MKQGPSKKILNKILVLIIIFQVILISLVLWLSSDWEEKKTYLLLAEALLWPLFVLCISIYYKYKHGQPIAKAIRYLLFGPYILIVGIIILITMRANERGEKIGTYYRKYTGQKMGDLYENDRENTFYGIIFSISVFSLIIGGAGCCYSGLKKIRQIKNSDTSNKRDQESQTIPNTETITEQVTVSTQQLESYIANFTDKEMISKLIGLARYYADGGMSKDNQKLFNEVMEIGRRLNLRGGLREMRRIFDMVPPMQGKRTVEMKWDGIGDWRG